MNIVLDLDETLIHSVFKNDKFTIHFRPYLKEFFSFIFGKDENGNPRFRKIGVWTAATKNYAKDVLKAMLNGKFITRENFEQLNKELMTRDKLIKDKKALAHYLNSDDLCKTIMVDDRDDVTSLNAGNTILIPPFKTSVKTAKKDAYLYFLIIYLEGILALYNNGLLECVPHDHPIILKDQVKLLSKQQST